jgi:fatty acid desaturase
MRTRPVHGVSILATGGVEHGRAAQSTRVARYRFAREIVKKVWECRHNDNYHGALELAEDWIIIGFSVFVSLLAFKNLPWVLSLPIYVVAVFFIGGRQRALADILHQAAHGTLLKNRRVGNFLGTVLSGYFVLQSLSGYRLSHVVRHHGFLGDPILDPDYEQYRLWNICGKDLNGAAVRRHLLRMFTPSSTLGYLKYLVKHRIFPPGEDPAERTIRVSIIAIITLLLGVLGYGHLLLFYWIVPLATTQAWIGAFLEIVEHYPMIETNRTFDIHMSRNRSCNWVTSFLLGLKQYDGYHLVHHQFPFVPSWRLPQAHRILMEDQLYRSLNKVHGWRAMLETILNPERSAAVKRG